MATEVTLTDLPEEMLVKIFSFLDFKELPKLFLVCSKFNTAAKEPSLWRRCEFKFHGDDSRKIYSFCSFFSQHPFLRTLSIIDSNIRSSDSFFVNSVYPFNQLFKNLKYLSCLNLNEYSTDIVLPPSLRHLTCKLASNSYYEDKFRFLDRCSKIERLHLEIYGAFPLSNAISSVLLKYQMTLSALHLEIDYFEKKWIPLIVNCLSLKEVGLEMFCVSSVNNLFNLFASSLSRRLKFLRVKWINTLQSFNGVEFPELKVLTTDSEVEDLMAILPLIKRMPKLHSFRFSGEVTHPNAGDFCSAVKSCKTLRDLLIRIEPVDFDAKDEFESIIRKLNEGSSEENQWKFSHEYTSEIFRMPAFECNCWNPTKNLIDQNQQQKQLRLVESRYFNRSDEESID